MRSGRQRGRGERKQERRGEERGNERRGEERRGEERRGEERRVETRRDNLFHLFIFCFCFQSEMMGRKLGRMGGKRAKEQGEEARQGWIV